MPLFSNAHERDDYFQRIEDDPMSVEFGSALRHAETFIGIWGSETLLREDCARIMCAELIKYGLLRGADPTDFNYFRPHSIDTYSNSFRAAFRAVREPAQNRVQNSLSAAIVEMHGDNAADIWKKHLPETMTDEQVDAVFDLHERIFRDIMNRGLHANFLKWLSNDPQDHRV